MNELENKRRELRAQVDALNKEAMDRYHEGYNNAAFKAATKELSGPESIDRANLLIDAALALCGHPYFACDDGPWTDAELDFLLGFVSEGEQGD